jgi:hypothetical protein
MKAGNSVNLLSDKSSFFKFVSSPIQFGNSFSKFDDKDKMKYSLKKLILVSPMFVFGKECIEHSLMELSINPKQEINFDITHLYKYIYSEAL